MDYDAKKIIDIVKKGTWFVQGFNGLPLYLHSVASNTGWMTKSVVGTNYSHFFLRIHEHRAHWYYDELDMQKVGEGYYRKVRSIAELRKLEKHHKAKYLAAQKKAGDITIERLENLSLKDMVRLAELMVQEQTLSVGTAHVQEGISFVSEQKLKNILKKRGLNTHENFQLLGSPVELSFLAEAQLLLGKIKSAQGTPKKKLARDFLSNFGWIDNSYVRGLKLTVQDVLLKAKQQKHLPSVKALNETKRKKARLIKLLKLSPQELFVVRTIEICSKWQDNRKKFIMQSLGRFEPLIEEISRRLEMTPENFKYITPKEVNYKNLTNRKFIAALRKRWPGCAYYTLKDNILVFPEKMYEQINAAVTKTDNSNVTELKGNIANKGVARGKVRIIRTIHDIPKVQRGEILVAYMTRPEFLPAMQKATAFVTNEGGVTSHAAIISREMNKPCIIGTKIATEVLKDGDMVEVNANHGVVRILK